MEVAMSYVSKQIYRKINDLVPNLQKIEPFTRIDLKDKGYQDIQLMVIDSHPDKVRFILTRYDNENGQLIANPSVEIVANPINQTANVKVYKDIDYFHAAVSKPEIGEIALSHANRFLYDWLKDLKNWNRSLSQNSFQQPPKKSGVSL
jgi:hypothetical protein